MGEVTTIGLDIAKSVFQVHGARRAVQGTKIAAGSRIDQELQRIGKGMTT